MNQSLSVKAQGSKKGLEEQLLPQDEYGGWLDKKSIIHFADYAEVAFRAFGKRVKHWTTFNEPWSFIFLGYDVGIHAPGQQIFPRTLPSTFIFIHGFPNRGPNTLMYISHMP